MKPVFDMDDTPVDELGKTTRPIPVSEAIARNA